MQTNSLSMEHPDYSRLAARVLATKMHKTTIKSFSRWVNTYGNGLFIVSIIYPTT